MSGTSSPWRKRASRKARRVEAGHDPRHEVGFEHRRGRCAACGSRRPRRPGRGQALDEKLPGRHRLSATASCSTGPCGGTFRLLAGGSRRRRHGEGDAARRRPPTGRASPRGRGTAGPAAAAPAQPPPRATRAWWRRERDIRPVLASLLADVGAAADEFKLGLRRRCTRRGRHRPATAGLAHGIGEGQFAAEGWAASTAMRASSRRGGWARSCASISAMERSRPRWACSAWRMARSAARVSSWAAARACSASAMTRPRSPPASVPERDQRLGGALPHPLRGDPVVEGLALVLQRLQALDQRRVAPLRLPRLAGIDGVDGEAPGAGALQADRAGIGGERQVVDDQHMLARRTVTVRRRVTLAPSGNTVTASGREATGMSAASAGRAAVQASARARILEAGAAGGAWRSRVSGHRMRTRNRAAAGLNRGGDPSKISRSGR